MASNPYTQPQTFPQDFQAINPESGTLSVAWYYFLFQFYQRFQTRIVTQPVTGASSLTIDWSAGANIILTLSASITTFRIINWPPSGQVGMMRFYITNSGHTITWPSGTKWPGGTPPTLTGTGTDIIQLETNNGGTTLYGTVVGQAYA